MYIRKDLHKVKCPCKQKQKKYEAIIYYISSVHWNGYTN